MPKDLSLDRVEVSLTPLERFEEYLQSRGMRNTEQRRVLVEYVFSQHDHFDADALIDKLPRKGQAGYVSRPTVYRTLNEFVDAGTACASSSWMAGPSTSTTTAIPSTIISTARVATS